MYELEEWALKEGGRQSAVALAAAAAEVTSLHCSTLLPGAFAAAHSSGTVAVYVITRSLPVLTLQVCGIALQHNRKLAV